jgi:hypothetical protein
MFTKKEMESHFLILISSPSEDVSLVLSYSSCSGCLYYSKIPDFRDNLSALPAENCVMLSESINS